MSAARRVRLFERDKGVCYLCNRKVGLTELWDIEHVIPWGLAFDDSDENLKTAHKNGCHEAKTKTDVKRIAKAKAQGGETGQWARRQKNGPTLKGRSSWPPKGKTKWPKRGFQNNRSDRENDR